jgi:hypothetical protein
VVFQATPGWQLGNSRLRALDEVGRSLRCLRVNPDALAELSDLRSGDAGRGTRHGVTAEDRLAVRLTEGPLLAPVPDGGVRVVRADSEPTFR